MYYALFVIFLIGCGSVPVLPVVGGADCSTACDRLRELGCEASQPTAKGASCETVCENVQASGIVEWDLTCRTAAASCEAVDECER